MGVSVTNPKRTPNLFRGVAAGSIGRDLITLHRRSAKSFTFCGASSATRLFAAAAKAPAYRESVLARQHQVENHQVVALAHQLPVHFDCVINGVHREALFVEVTA